MIISSNIISLSYLQAKKSEDGEQCRTYETNQLLSAISRCNHSFLPMLLQYQPPSPTTSSTSSSSSPLSSSTTTKATTTTTTMPIIITGDFNACPTKNSNVFGYPCTVYPLLKNHSSNLRSIYNDDLLSVLYEQRKSSLFYDNKLRINFPTVFKDDSPLKLISNQSNSIIVDRDSNDDASNINDTNDEFLDEDMIWTTWKTRRKKGVEQVVKHCIDYIFYSSPNIQAVSVLGLFEGKDIAPELFPSESYPSDHIALVADLKFKSS